MSDFDPAVAAAALRQQIIDTAPRLFTENVELRAKLAAAEGENKDLEALLRIRAHREEKLRALLREARDWRADNDPPYTLNSRIDAALREG